MDEGPRALERPIRGQKHIFALAVTASPSGRLLKQLHQSGSQIVRRKGFLKDWMSRPPFADPLRAIAAGKSERDLALSKFYRQGFDALTGYVHV
jgi:hypothetical protein